MDFLIEASEEIQHQVFLEVAKSVNLDVDLIFLDTTTTHSEIGGEDEDVVDDEGEVSPGLRKEATAKTVVLTRPRQSSPLQL